MSGPAGEAGRAGPGLGRVVVIGAHILDVLGEVLAAALRRHGVDTAGLVRKPGVQTSATILPIRPNGERPALRGRLQRGNDRGPAARLRPGRRRVARLGVWVAGGDRPRVGRGIVSLDHAIGFLSRAEPGAAGRIRSHLAA